MALRPLRRRTCWTPAAQASSYYESAFCCTRKSVRKSFVATLASIFSIAWILCNNQIKIETRSCRNHGCNPSSAYVRSSTVSHSIANAKSNHFSFDKYSISMETFFRRRIWALIMWNMWCNQRRRREKYPASAYARVCLLHMGWEDRARERITE